MSERYVESIPSDIAKLIVGEAYNPDLQYKLVTERDFSCISAYNPKTGESVAVSADGDDLNLDVEEFQRDKRLEEEFVDVSEEVTQKRAHLGSRLLTAGMVVIIVAVLIFALIVLREVA